MKNPIVNLKAGPIAVAAFLFLSANSFFTAPLKAADAPPTPPASFFDDLSQRSTLLGDLGGLRPALGRSGATLTITETSEVLGDVSGGQRQSFDYDGVTQLALQVDTRQAVGWHGGTFNVSALQIHGSNLSSADLDSLETASGIEADRATRLWELWYQQTFFEDERLDIKVGQQSLDQEFMVSQNELLFVNTVFGWPMLPTADFPGGGPVYPLSALGVRVRMHLSNTLTVLAGIYNGSPVTNSSGDPQKQNPSGTTFALNGGALAIAELQYAYPPSTAASTSGAIKPLSRVYKLGVWYDSEEFADEQFDNTGLSLANPGSTGIPQTHRGDYGFYGILDRAIWQSTTNPDTNINFFTRLMGSPAEDRNLIDFAFNTGFTFHGMIPQRNNDTFGLGLAYTKVGDHASALDHDTGSFTGTYFPVRGREAVLEVTYQYQLAPWCQVQPDLQYVINPGAGVLDPNRPGQRVENELVLGVRMNISL